MFLTVLAPEYIMGKAFSERLAAASSLETLRSRFGEEMEMIHAYIMNMGGYYLDFSEVDFAGVELSHTSCSISSGMSSTAVNYSGVHFSGNLFQAQSRPHNSRNRGQLGSELLTLAESSDEPLPNTLVTSVESKTTLKAKLKNESSCNHPAQQFSEHPVLESFDTSFIGHLPETPKLKDNARRRVSSNPIIQVPIRDLSSFQILNLTRFNQESWTLTALQLLSAKGLKLYNILPPVSQQELESLSNNDALVKILALVQIIWLIVQLVVRYRSNVLSSQLEIAVLAFSVCSILTYIILWDRPRGVTTRYRIKAIRAPNVDEITLLATFGPGYLWTWNRSQARRDEDLHLLPIPNDASHAVDVRNLVGKFENTALGRSLIEWHRYNHPALVSVIAGSVFGGTIFGGIHCLAWNFSFPTYSELILWRVCSLITTLFPILSAHLALQWLHYKGRIEPLEENVSWSFRGPILLSCFLVPYVFARTFLVVETFRTLFFLPPEVFMDTWTGAFLLWG